MFRGPHGNLTNPRGTWGNRMFHAGEHERTSGDQHGNVRGTLRIPGERTGMPNLAIVGVGTLPGIARGAPGRGGIASQKASIASEKPRIASQKSESRHNFAESRQKKHAFSSRGQCVLACRPCTDRLPRADHAHSRGASKRVPERFPTCSPAVRMGAPLVLPPRIRSCSRDAHVCAPVALPRRARRFSQGVPVACTKGSPAGSRAFPGASTFSHARRPHALPWRVGACPTASPRRRARRSARWASASPADADRRRRRRRPPNRLAYTNAS